jgi:hypothetical protein
VASNNTPAPTNLEVLWQEMEHQKRLTTDLTSQVQRVRRFARVDELEAVTGKLEKESVLSQTVTELSKAVHVLANVRQRELSVDEMGQNYHRQNTQRREREVASHLSRYRYMSTLKQVTTPRCPCGQHIGIRFETPDGKVIEENYCPTWWWIAMSRMSFQSGKNKEFHQKYPMTKWVDKYIIKSTDKVGSKS